MYIYLFNLNFFFVPMFLFFGMDPDAVLVCLWLKMVFPDKKLARYKIWNFFGDNFKWGRVWNFVSLRSRESLSAEEEEKIRRRSKMAPGFGARDQSQSRRRESLFRAPNQDGGRRLPVEEERSARAPPKLWLSISRDRAGRTFGVAYQINAQTTLFSLM